ncbi:helix-turn-helix domain-containing protein [Paenibacillus sp. JSM ZJ436]|uniref:helix-turn-helix domain-containing protein n=1 Tax=Paenibacillus sp. JSM ZJ436 TaxID=3376190 RepID=UPI0037B04F25
MFVVDICLKQIIQERGISERELSRRTGIRQPTINAMCNNQSSSIPLKNLANICGILECDISDVLKLRNA